MLSALTKTSTVTWIIAAIVGLGVLKASYDRGRDVERGKSAKRIERLADNYVRLVVNEKIEAHYELGNEREASREAYEMVLLAFDMRGEVEMANRAFYEERARRAREEASRETQILNRLGAMRHEWLEQRVPNSVVCELYDGVRDIAGCADIRAAGEPDEAGHGLDVFGSEPAAYGDRAGAER